MSCHATINNLVVATLFAILVFVPLVNSKVRCCFSGYDPVLADPHSCDQEHDYCYSAICANSVRYTGCFSGPKEQIMTWANMGCARITNKKYYSLRMCNCDRCNLEEDFMCEIHEPPVEDNGTATFLQNLGCIDPTSTDETTTTEEITTTTTGTLNTTTLEANTTSEKDCDCGKNGAIGEAIIHITTLFLFDLAITFIGCRCWIYW